MNNCNELRAQLSSVFESLVAGETDVKTAAELANIAGKMINSAKAQIEYYALRKETPKISFLDSK